MSACCLARVAQVPYRVHVEPVQPRLQTAHRPWGRSLGSDSWGCGRSGRAEAVLSGQAMAARSGSQSTLWSRFFASPGKLSCGLCIQYFIVSRADRSINRLWRVPFVHKCMVFIHRYKRRICIMKEITYYIKKGAVSTENKLFLIITS